MARPLLQREYSLWLLKGANAVLLKDPLLVCGQVRS